MASSRCKTLRPISTEIDRATLAELDKAAASENLSRSELMRKYIAEGLKVKSYEDNYDKLTRIIRQEINSVLNLDDIRTISNNNTERIIKVLIKFAKTNNAAYFLLLAYLNEIAPPENYVERVTETIKLSMQYMSSKDDSMLNDTDKLIRLVSGL